MLSTLLCMTAACMMARQLVWCDCCRCTEMSGQHERSLHTRRCGGTCQHGRFCSSHCLKHAWRVHRLVCEKVRSE